MSKKSAVILAAGQGTRMKSPLPKVLHPIAGRPLIHYPVRAAIEAGADEIVVVIGHGAELVHDYLANAFGTRVRTALQAERRGTGHAASMALPVLSSESTTTFVFYADAPLLEGADLRTLVDALDRSAGAELALLTCTVDDPAGYGRVLRDEQGRVTCIREDRDLANDHERRVREINPGMYLVRTGFLRRALPELRPNNAQGELYFTDLVEMAARAGGAVTSLVDGSHLIGVNDRAQLAAAERALYARTREKLGKAGVTIHGEPLIDDSVEVEKDATIGPGVVLRGATVIAEGATIDVGCVVTDSTVGERAMLKPYTVVTSSRIGARAEIGPFTHLRPESDIGEEVHLGNFVETKKTVMHRGSKANHLSYLGNGIIGEKANIGAGTIFCNYDGFAKHTTVIGKSVFVGSDSQIVAPVTIGDGAYVATGTTVTEDVPGDALAIGRARQQNKADYAPRLRSKLAAQAKAKSGK